MHVSFILTNFRFQNIVYKYPVFERSLGIPDLPILNVFYFNNSVKINTKFCKKLKVHGTLRQTNKEK